MPIDTTAIGNKVLRIVDGRVKNSTPPPTRPARPAPRVNHPAASKTDAKSNTSPPRPTVEYRPAPVPTHNAWGNTAGLKEVKSDEKVVDTADTKSNTSPPRSTKMDYRPAPAPTHNAWGNTAGIKKVKAAEKVIEKAADRPTTPEPKPAVVVPEITASGKASLTGTVQTYPLTREALPNLSTSPKKQAQPSSRQAAKKGGKKNKSAAVLNRAMPDKTHDTPKAPNNPKKTGAPAKDEGVHTKAVSKDTQLLVAAPASAEQVVEEKVFEKQNEVAPAEAQGKVACYRQSCSSSDSIAANTSQNTSESVPSANKPKKKPSGAAQKKAKAARRRAAAEANLDAAYAAASLSAEQTTLSKNVEELKLSSHAITSNFEADQQQLRAKLLENLVVLQNKNIEIAELGEANWILQDKDGKHLSDSDQQVAASVCKEYKVYSLACEAMALSGRARQAVAEIEEAQRMFGAPATDVFSWEKAKYSQMPKEKIVEARHSSPQPGELSMATGNFDFKLDDSAPKFKKAYPIASRKMEFSPNVFGTPDSLTQGSVSSSPLITTIPQASIDSAVDDAENTVAADTKNVSVPTIELASPSSPKEDPARVLSEVGSSDAIITTNQNTPTPGKNEVGIVEQFVNDAASDTILEAPTSPVDSPVPSTIEHPVFEAADTTTTANNTPAMQESTPPASSAEELSSVVPATAVGETQDLDVITTVDKDISIPQPKIEEVTTEEDTLVLSELSNASTPATDICIDQSNNRVGVVPTMPSNIGNRDAIKRDPFFATFNRDNVPKTKTESDSGIHDLTTSESSVLPDDSADTQDHGPTHEEMHNWAQAASRHNGFAPAISDTKTAEKSVRRNTTQIGITTLREFYTSLADPAASSHTKVDLIAAFVAMSSVEREELDLGPIHAHNAKAVLTNLKLQHNIFLGNIKLAEFLKIVDFNANGEATNAAIVQAWVECAKKDAEAEALEAQLTRG